MTRPLSRRILGGLILLVAAAEAFLSFRGNYSFTRKPTLIVAPLYAPGFDAKEIEGLRTALERELAATGTHALYPKSLIENFYLERDNAVDVFDGSYVGRDEAVELGAALGVERVAVVTVLEYSDRLNTTINITDVETAQTVTSATLETADYEGFLDWTDMEGRPIDLMEAMDIAVPGLSISAKLFLGWLATLVVIGSILAAGLSPQRIIVECLAAAGMLLALFSWIYALNGDMDYVQRFVATSGLLRIEDTGFERTATALRYAAPLLLLAVAWGLDAAGRMRKASPPRDGRSSTERRPRPERSPHGLRRTRPDSPLPTGPRPRIGFPAAVDATAPLWAALSAILYSFSLPNFLVLEGLPALAWIATAPFYIALRSVRWGRGVFLAVLFTGLQALMINWWQGTFSYVSLPFTVALTLVQYVPFALLMAWTVGRFPRYGILAAPLFWTAFDWFRSLGFLGYPWGLLGVSQYAHPAVIQSAAIGGVWMVSLLPHLTGAALAWALAADPESPGFRGLAAGFRENVFPRRIVPLAASLILVLAVWAAGAAAIAVRDSREAEILAEGGRRIRILAVQQNTDPRKHDYHLSFEELSRLTEEALAAEGPFDLVAWPESGFVPDVRFWLDERRSRWRRGKLVRTFLDWQAETGVPLVTGTQDHFFEDAPPSDDPEAPERIKRIRNSAMYLPPNRSGDGDRHYYYKIRLVPFTENFPYHEEFPWVAELLHNFSTTQWTPGAEHTVQSAPAFRFSTPICFEDVFPDHVRRFASAGAEVFVNMSNDYWANTPLEGYQHAAHAVFRTVENRRPLIRATCSGWTISVDTEGRIDPQWPEFYTPGWIVGDFVLPPVPETTLYGRWGDWFPVLCGILWALLLVIEALLNRRREENPAVGIEFGDSPSDASGGEGRLWWKHGVLYQIYPRSFADSDGDGIGDLAGLTGKLDYLESLGVDGLWLSPIFPSPMADFGYDISDYRGIDPVFGDLASFGTFVEEAHRRGIRIILDMVFNHSSDRHPWFLESRSSREAAKRDWYVWHPGRPPRRKGGRPRLPNNWRGAFGGPAWTWDEATGEYYLHSFLPEQPDLNWHNPEVREELYGILRFWMEKGVDGFRFDVINYIAKDREFRSNPYRLHKALPRRFEQQDHVRDRCRPESHAYLKELRRVLDEYPERMSVGEVFPNEGVIDQAATAAYLGGGADGKELHMAFDFSPNYAPWRASAFARLLAGQYRATPPGGQPVHVLSNHDQSRAAARLAKGHPDRIKLLLALLLTQRGTPFLYYGDEIGMTDGKIPRGRLQDPVGIKYWPFHPGRDPARTPMQWNPGPKAGFTDGEPWLPIPESAEQVNVAAQDGDPESILSFARALIALRRERRSLDRGTWEQIEAPRGVLAYRRRAGEEATVVLLNFSRRKKRVPVPAGGEILLDSRRPVSESGIVGLEMQLEPFQAVVVGFRMF